MVEITKKDGKTGATGQEKSNMDDAGPLLGERGATFRGVRVTPLNAKEAEALAHPEKLGQVTLTGMAAERRWQAEAIERGEEIEDWEGYEWYEQLGAEMTWRELGGEEQKDTVRVALASRIKEAEALEEEADARNPANKGRISSRTIAEAGEMRPSGPVGAGVPRGESTTGRIKTVLGVSRETDGEERKKGGDTWGSALGEEMGGGRGVRPEGTRIRKPTPVERADTLCAAPENAARTPTEVARSVGTDTVDLPPEEDFSRHGDILYAIEWAFREAGEPAQLEGPEEIEKNVERAIGILEAFSSTKYAGAGRISLELRKEQLELFRKEFFATGEEAPEKDVDAYRLWLERKRAEYKDIGEVFELLGIAPGEQGREGALKVCGSVLSEGKLGTVQEKQVKKLVHVLESKKSEWDIDEFAAERNAELAYEMVVGLCIKAERELGKARVSGIMRLEEEAKGNKLEIAGHEDTLLAMRKKLAALHEINRREELLVGRLAGQLGMDASELGQGHKERKTLMGHLFNDVAGKGERGKELMDAAEENAAKKLGVARITIDTVGKTAASAPAKLHGPVASGIGSAIKVAMGGALVIGTLWLSEHGLRLPSFGEVQEKELVVAVIEVPEKQAPAKEAMDGGVETLAAEEDAGVEEIGAEEIEKKPVEKKEYARDAEGLSRALDDVCENERGLLVSGRMLRAAYASIEGQLDGSVLPVDLEWIPLMLEMKFPNRVVELAIMSDLARRDLEHAEKYAAFKRIAIMFGERAGSPKGFSTSIREANRKGMGLPELENEFPVGQFENARTGKECLAAAYNKRAAERMLQLREEAIEAGMGGEQFKGEVDALLGNDAKRLGKRHRSAAYLADREMKKDYCRALTGGRSGSDALERALGKVLPMWGKAHKKAVRAEERRRGEVDEILGPEKARDNKSLFPAKGSPCKGLEGLDYFSCVSKQNLKIQQAERDSGEKKMSAPKEKKREGAPPGAKKMPRH